MRPTEIKPGDVARIAVRDGRHPYRLGTLVQIGDVVNRGALALVYPKDTPGAGWVATACLESAL